jgi:YidC/Oxa1 family membrane protein insertase
MQQQTDNKNLFLAIALSVLVIIGWNAFYGVPQMEQQRQAQQTQPATQPVPGAQPVPQPQAGAQPGAPATAPAAAPSALPREAVLETAPRVTIDTPRLKGSISLRGGRIDDLRLVNYRETINPNSANIVLFSPEGASQAYYADFGWVNAPGQTIALPTPQTVWTADRSTLTPDAPVTLTYDNGQGLRFKRVVTVDRNFMFTVTDSVENVSGQATTLYPYALISRHGTPQVAGFFILHEGMIGVLGDAGLQEVSYSDLQKAKVKEWTATGGFIGITDKYWAAALVPEQAQSFKGRYTVGGPTTLPIYQTDVLLGPQTAAPGGTASTTTRLFAGAKEVSVIDGYEKNLGIKRFDLMIDWGWFYFITKPMFQAMYWINSLVHNFGVTILIITLLIKAVFFPLANKSYESMARMKAVQPRMVEIQTRYKDDKMAQQKALMELYKTEKINPLAGCWPVLIQIPVFFALYKVLFVTIEMRHAPFFGWIKDLAAPDPTSIFNLFGLLPYSVPDFLLIGVWPLIMGITMWLQMKMNPEPTDPVQKAVFGWMPVLFTFMLASFPAGLVIYWAWNNALSISQQYLIMKRQGVKIELWDNISNLFKKSPKPAE